MSTQWYSEWPLIFYVNGQVNANCTKVVTHAIAGKRIIINSVFLGTTAKDGSTVHSKPEDKKDAAEHLIGIP